MSMRPAATLVAAAVLASTTAFAQTKPATTTTHNRESAATPVTLIGCVQKESDYRRQHNLKRGGRLQTGLGEGDEYVLINATRVTPGSTPTSVSTDCSSASSGEAFEITGGREEAFKAFVGQRVEVSGTQKRAKIGPTGRPTGGSDPMGGDLRLFEVEVSSVKEAVMAQTAPPATTAPAPATTAPATTAPAPATTAPPPAPAPTATAGRTATTAPTTTLPHTASPLPLYGLASLLFLGGAYGVRRLRTR